MIYINSAPHRETEKEREKVLEVGLTETKQGELPGDHSESPDWSDPSQQCPVDPSLSAGGEGGQYLGSQHPGGSRHFRDG